MGINPNLKGDFMWISACAPPPGKYDPKFDTKVKGAVIEKSKRFVEPKLSSASSAESIESIGKSSGNISVLPVFRTVSNFYYLYSLFVLYWFLLFQNNF